MNADDRPTTPDDAVERFAAAVEDDAARRPSDGPVDPDLARELGIVDRLVAQGSAWDPDPETRARARRRLLAALAEDVPRAAGGGPSRAS